MALQIGQRFPSIAAAKAAIKTFIADQHESFKTSYSDKTRYRIICTNNSCEFQIRVADSKKNGILLTHLKPHTCNPGTHFSATNTHSLAYLLSHHRAAVIDNPNITVKQIQSNERLHIYTAFRINKPTGLSSLFWLRSGVMNQSALQSSLTILHVSRQHIQAGTLQL